MDCWGVLGLEGPTNDLKIIKRAYAKKLKTTRPDDDPEGFMALREAYESTKFEIAYEQLEAKGLGGHNNDDETSLDTTDSSDIKTLMDNVMALLSSKKMRYKRVVWDDIFDKVHELSIDDFQDFEEVFRIHVLEFFGYFENDIFKSNARHSPPIINSEIGLLFSRRLGWYNRYNRPYEIQRQIIWLNRELWITQPHPDHLALRHKLKYPQDPFVTNLCLSIVLIGAAIIGALAVDFVFPRLEIF